MRTEVFHEEHDVVLSEDERNLRGRQAARQAQAIKNAKALIETETEAWKERKKSLETREKELTQALYDVSRAAETGVEPRQVPCLEVLRGVMIETVRQDTGESVSTRSATKDELRTHEGPVVVPGGGATRAKPKPKSTGPADTGIVDDDYQPPTH